MTYTAAKFHELARKPKSISWEAAASIPIGGSVAYQALFDYPLLDHPSSNDWGRRALALGLNRGKRILITAAGTPAGLWAVQLAKLAGVSKIVATCAAADIMAVLDMGADEACNWTNEGSLANWDGEPFDIVVDFMGGLTLTLAWGLVKENGKILSTTDEDMLDAMPDVVKPGIQHFPFLLEHTPKYLNVISSLLDRDIATWWLEHSDVFDIAQHEMACARLASSSRGQVVLALDDGTPQSLIAQLEKHQEEWRDLRPFNQYTMEAARLEARPERFEFCRWLRNVGSNNLDEVLRGSPEPMMPPPRPPPPPTPRSRQLPLVKSVSWSSGSESSSSDGSGGATNFKKMVEEQEREKGGRRPPSLGCQFPAWVKPDGTEKHGMEA
ncbi:hypothetical protein N0V88_001065 [Collariella sp. IMI 366227]|nr:hypothetical protein N0V88_001065 [Collariella sp. IMI 366227]